MSPGSCSSSQLSHLGVSGAMAPLGRIAPFEVWFYLFFWSILKNALGPSVANSTAEMQRAANVQLQSEVSNENLNT